MITASNITDEQIRELRDRACQCRPRPPVRHGTSAVHSAAHDCDVDDYEDAVLALDHVGDARARCAEILEARRRKDDQ